MEICLFDKYLSDDNQKHLLKEFDQNEYAGYFVENAAFDIDFASDEYSKTMNLFLTIKNGFLTKHFVAFVDFLIETKVFDWKMKVVLIDEMSDNSRVSIEWLQELKKLYFSNLEIVAEVDVAEFDEKVPKLKEILSKKVDFCENTKKNNNVTIYTDGACSGNPGAGGWGAILMHGDRKKEFSGFEKETTNNRMELTAVIESLSKLKDVCNVSLYSDSAYVVNAINNGWLENWKKNGWIGSDKKAVKNIELWKALDELLNKHTVQFIKVKGHSDNEFNNRCDQLATGEIAKNANV